MPLNEKQFINSKELSALIGLPVTAIQRLVREKRIPAYQLDKKQYLFDADEVCQVIKNKRVN